MSKLGYFVASRVLGESVSSVQVLVNYPLSPHRPVVAQVVIGKNHLIPRLAKPQEIPTKRPH
eukprot:8035732-Pyramimonas_sp.AAC.1